jgi:hypothetical protein
VGDSVERGEFDEAEEDAESVVEGALEGLLVVLAGEVVVVELSTVCVIDGLIVVRIVAAAILNT